MDKFCTSRKTYKISKVLGSGGSGKVLKVYDSVFDPSESSPLAFKLLDNDHLCPVLRNYFLRFGAFKMKANLNFLGFEVWGKKVVMKFPFLDGLVFSDLLEGPVKLKIDEFEDWFFQCSYGIMELKAAGLFHGDVSENNIMIDPHRGCYLIDPDPRLDRATFDICYSVKDTEYDLLCLERVFKSLLLSVAYIDRPSMSDFLSRELVVARRTPVSSYLEHLERNNKFIRRSYPFLSNYLRDSQFCNTRRINLRVSFFQGGVLVFGASILSVFYLFLGVNSY